MHQTEVEEIAKNLDDGVKDTLGITGSRSGRRLIANTDVEVMQRSSGAVFGNFPLKKPAENSKLPEAPIFEKSKDE